MFKKDFLKKLWAWIQPILVLLLCGDAANNHLQTDQPPQVVEVKQDSMSFGGIFKDVSTNVYTITVMEGEGAHTTMYAFDWSKNAAPTKDEILQVIKDKGASGKLQVVGVFEHYPGYDK